VKGAGSELEKEVRRILRELGSATIPQIMGKLQSKTSYQAVKKALERMISRGEVVRPALDSREARYYFAYIPITEWLEVSSHYGESKGEGVQQVPVKVKSSYEIEESDYRRKNEKKSGLLLEIVESMMVGLDTKKVESVFREAAKCLLNEDPRELYFKFAKWLFEEFKKAVDSFLKAKDRGLSMVAENAKQKIEFLSELAEGIYVRQLGIPNVKGKGPFRLYFDARKMDDTSQFNPVELRRRLESAIFGDTFIEKIKTKELSKPFHIVGTDASQFVFTPAELLRTPFDKLPIAIITAVACRYDLYTNEQVGLDYYPTPTTWLTYKTQEAINEGLIIPPQASLQLDGLLWERTLSAAMNLRQYKKDLESFQMTPDGITADVVFRDGRLFPLEHEFSDYLSGKMHGHMVRRSLDAFKLLVSDIGSSETPTPLYCGVVKRPSVELIAPLVFWYMRYGSVEKLGKPIWPDMDESKFLFGYVMSDEQTVMFLFLALARDLKENEHLVTCRFLRRFYYMVEPEILKKIFEKNPQTDDEWEGFFEKLIDERDSLIKPKAATYAMLCSKAAVLSFYCSVKGARTGAQLSVDSNAIPRYEILVPFTLLNDTTRLREKEKEYVVRVATALADPMTLDIYPEKTRGNARPILPKAICRAHEFAKSTARLFAKEFVGELLSLAFKLFKEMKLGGDYVSQ
jgi:hypothetical protein